MFKFNSIESCMKWFMSGLEMFVYRFNKAYWVAFMRSPNFVGLIGALALCIFGVFSKKGAKMGICLFFGFLLAVFSVVDYVVS